MQRCENYPGFCQLGANEVHIKKICDQRMYAYYFCSDGLICPACKTKEDLLYDTWYINHRNHLTPFTTDTKLNIIRRLQKQKFQSLFVNDADDFDLRPKVKVVKRKKQTKESEVKTKVAKKKKQPVQNDAPLKAGPSNEGLQRHNAEEAPVTDKRQVLPLVQNSDEGDERDELQAFSLSETQVAIGSILSPKDSLEGFDWTDDIDYDKISATNTEDMEKLRNDMRLTQTQSTVASNFDHNQVDDNLPMISVTSDVAITTSVTSDTVDKGTTAASETDGNQEVTITTSVTSDTVDKGTTAASETDGIQEVTITTSVTSDTVDKGTTVPKFRCNRNERRDGTKSVDLSAEDYGGSNLPIIPKSKLLGKFPKPQKTYKTFKLQMAKYIRDASTVIKPREQNSECRRLLNRPVEIGPSKWDQIILLLQKQPEQQTRLEETLAAQAEQQRLKEEERFLRQETQMAKLLETLTVQAEQQRLKEEERFLRQETQIAKLQETLTVQAEQQRSQEAKIAKKLSEVHEELAKVKNELRIKSEALKNFL